MVALSGKWISWAHTLVAYSAFLGALVVGLSLHYQKIVQNEYYVRESLLSKPIYNTHCVKGIPTRMVPVGLFNHWRSIPRTCCLSILHCNDFRQVFYKVRCCRANFPSGPRFVLVFLWYVLTARPNSTLPKIVAGVGLFRTLSCGGWTYVTSTDDHGWHDIFMISYLVATLPWTLGCLSLSPHNGKAVRYRKILAGSFFGTLVPLIYFFIQHKVHKVPGGECSLILLMDLLVDD